MGVLCELARAEGNPQRVEPLAEPVCRYDRTSTLRNELQVSYIQCDRGGPGTTVASGLQPRRSIGHRLLNACTSLLWTRFEYAISCSIEIDEVDEVKAVEMDYPSLSYAMPSSIIRPIQPTIDTRRQTTSSSCPRIFQMLVIMQDKHSSIPLFPPFAPLIPFHTHPTYSCMHFPWANLDTYIPAPILICLTIFLSSTTSPLAFKICSNASKTRSKDDLAPFSCVKRAMAMLARRPRWRRVWNSAATEREGMWRAASKLA